MGHPQIAAFARLANGNVKPTRNIFGNNTLITRSIHSLAYDPVKDELVVPQFHSQAIQFFRGGANGDEAPLRMIMGPDVKVPNFDNLAIDSVHREIFVGDGPRRKIFVFNLDATGNSAPIRELVGPDTRLPYSHSTFAPSIDPVHNLLFVGGGGGILVFNRTDSGNTKPMRIIRAPKNIAGRGPGTPVVDPESGLLFSTYNSDPPAAKGSRLENNQEVNDDYDQYSEHSYLGVWSIYDNGEVAPRWAIAGGPNGIMRDPVGRMVDAKRKTVYIVDRYTNSVLEYFVPEIFDTKISPSN